MMRHRLKLLLVFVLASLSACQGTEAGQETLTQHQSKQDTHHRLIIMGQDGSGSYELWDQAKQIAQQIITQLNPGDIFYLRTITQTSYTDDSTVFRLELPQLPDDENHNPFDRRQKLRRKVYVLRSQALKKDARQRIDELKPIGAKKTDVYGFLAVASEKLAMNTTATERIVIIASDLRDNVRYRPELDLSAAHIAVVGFQAMKDPRQTQQLKNRWQTVFSKAGATKVNFIRTEEQFILSRF